MGQGLCTMASLITTLVLVLCVFLLTALRHSRSINTDGLFRKSRPGGLLYYCTLLRGAYTYDAPPPPLLSKYTTNLTAPHAE